MKNLFVTIFILLFISCSEEEIAVNYSLTFAGANRHELEKVLTHYKNDPLKLKAARFLIGNMPNYYFYEGVEIDTLKSMIRTHGGPVLLSDDKLRYLRNFPYRNLTKKYDCHVITSDYLIRNIDLSFEAWQNQPWNKELGFDDFCELILPYRLSDEPLESWRELYREKYAPLLDSLYSGNDVVEACNILAKEIAEEGFNFLPDIKIPNPGPHYLFENRVGTCIESTQIALYVMRSLGIPVSVDTYIHSPEFNGSHRWNVVRDTTGVYLPFWCGEYDANREMKDDGRKKGKVYRKMFGLQKERMHYVKKHPDAPELFRDFYLKDVTANYTGENQIEFMLAKQTTSKQAYLSIFSYDGWLPIDKGVVKNNKVSFSNLEPNLIYLPVDENKKAFTYPFIFTGSKLLSLEPDTKYEEVTLTRKYPVHSHIVNYMNKHVIGARIEAANDPSFHHSTVLHEIRDTITTNRNLLTFGTPLTYRYYRWCPPPGRNVELAEFILYNDLTASSIPLRIHNINEHPPFLKGRDESLVERLVDGNPLT